MCINSETYYTFLSQEKDLRSERALNMALGEIDVSLVLVPAGLVKSLNRCVALAYRQPWY